LSQQEFDECKEIFRAFDTNGDGELDHAELLEALKEFGADDELIDKFVAEFDINKDGHIDLQEFVKLCATLTKEQEAKFESQVREVFDQFDKDRDNKLDAEELLAALKEFGAKEADINEFV
jgi:Ca2+-binding EF-hand superfamily protein